MATHQLHLMSPQLGISRPEIRITLMQGITVVMVEGMAQNMVGSRMALSCSSRRIHTIRREGGNRSMRHRKGHRQEKVIISLINEENAKRIGMPMRGKKCTNNKRFMGFPPALRLYCQACNWKESATLG